MRHDISVGQSRSAHMFITPTHQRRRCINPVSVLPMSLLNMASLMTQDKAPRLRHFYESILVFYFALFNYKLSDYKYSYSKMHSVHYAQLLCLQIVTFLSSAAVFFVDQRRLHCPVTFPHICGWHGSLPLCLWFRSHEGSAPDPALVLSMSFSSSQRRCTDGLMEYVV